jgi:hypothetical protein
VKKTQRSEHADKSKNTHPPVSVGLDYVDTDSVHPAEHDRRLSPGHKVSTTREMQYPDPRNKPSRNIPGKSGPEHFGLDAGVPTDAEEE